MADIKIPVSDATDKQLREFVTVFLQLDIKDTAKREQMLAKMSEAGWTMPFITMANPEPELSGSRPSGYGQSRKNERGEDEIKILINASDKQGGDNPAFLSLNGTGIYVPRGEECWMPVKYLPCLTDAVEFVYDTDDDGAPKHPPRKVQSYPFQVIA